MKKTPCIFSIELQKLYFPFLLGRTTRPVNSLHDPYDSKMNGHIYQRIIQARMAIWHRDTFFFNRTLQRVLTAHYWKNASEIPQRHIFFDQQSDLRSQQDQASTAAEHKHALHDSIAIAAIFSYLYLEGRCICSANLSAKTSRPHLCLQRTYHK